MPADSDRLYKLPVAFGLAAAFWTGDSILHYSGYGESRFEIVPSDLNELWMRALVCFLIIGIGFLSSRHGIHLTRLRVRETAARERLRRYEDVYGNAIVGLHLLLNRVSSRGLPPEEFCSEAKATIAAAVKRIRDLSGEHETDPGIWLAREREDLTAI